MMTAEPPDAKADPEECIGLFEDDYYEANKEEFLFYEFEEFMSTFLSSL